MYREVSFRVRGRISARTVTRWFSWRREGRQSFFVPLARPMPKSCRIPRTSSFSVSIGLSTSAVVKARETLCRKARQMVVLPTPMSPVITMNPSPVSSPYIRCSSACWWLADRKRNPGSGVSENGRSVRWKYRSYMSFPGRYALPLPFGTVDPRSSSDVEAPLRTAQPVFLLRRDLRRAPSPEDAGRDQDDQLRLLLLLVGGPEQQAEEGDVTEERHGPARLLRPFSHQAPDEDGLSVAYGNHRVGLTDVHDGRGVSIGGGRLPDLLRDRRMNGKHDVPVPPDLRGDAQDDPLRERVRGEGHKRRRGRGGGRDGGPEENILPADPDDRPLGVQGGDFRRRKHVDLALFGEGIQERVEFRPGDADLA